MATIKDVAKRANVSTTTVSHVINKTRKELLPERLYPDSGQRLERSGKTARLLVDDGAKAR